MYNWSPEVTIDQERLSPRILVAGRAGGLNGQEFPPVEREIRVQIPAGPSAATDTTIEPYSFSVLCGGWKISELSITPKLNDESGGH